jgi:hypothetical protein
MPVGAVTWVDGPLAEVVGCEAVGWLTGGREGADARLVVGAADELAVEVEGGAEAGEATEVGAADGVGAGGVGWTGVGGAGTEGALTLPALTVSMFPAGA